MSGTQVIATAVSHAAVLSPTNTSIQEIGRGLGLDPRMIRKCQSRFDSLTDGDWEALFDDRQAVRSDTLPVAWLDFVRQYWTDPFLADADGKAYNFVRRSESQSDEMRDPKDRKSTERYRLHWLEARVGDMYDACVKDGRSSQWFGPRFHVSWPKFLDERPF